MSYSTGEAAILTVLRADDSFAANNTARANWKVLNSGKGTKGTYVILRPGESSVLWISPIIYMATYITVAEVWQRYTDDATTQANLYAAVANVMNALMPERRLNSSAITDATVRAIPVITEMWKDGADGPSWLKQEVAVEWKEETEITFTD